MRKSVRDIGFDFTAQREGFTPYMYADVLNLVTTGVGNLIDRGPNNPAATTRERAALNNVVSASAMAPAMLMPWKLKAPGWTSKNPLAGERVSPAEIADAWTKVKRQNEVVPGFAQKGGGAYANLTNITLDLDGIRNLFNGTADRFNATLVKHFPDFESWPADAQLATLFGMSWALGPDFPAHFPQFKAAALKRDFDAAGAASKFQGVAGQKRNPENAQMFANAAQVERSGADPEVLIFPGGPHNVSPASPPSAVATLAPSGRSMLATLVLVGAVGAGGYAFYRYGLPILTAPKRGRAS